MNRFVSQAPVIVTVVAERPNIGSQVGAALKNKPFYLIDIGISAEHFCLQATELGLGTCMVGWFAERKVKRMLGIPGSGRPVLLITLGWPAEGSYATTDGRKHTVPGAAENRKRRKPLAAIASSEHYGRPWPGDSRQAARSSRVTKG